LNHDLRAGSQRAFSLSPVKSKVAFGGKRTSIGGSNRLDRSKMTPAVWKLIHPRNVENTILEQGIEPRARSMI